MARNEVCCSLRRSDSDHSCAVRKYALGGALANSTGTFSSDNDPELIREASPFSLKLIEALLAQSPKNPNLLLALTSGFTRYTAAFVFSDADYTQDPANAAAMRQRWL